MLTGRLNIPRLFAKRNFTNLVDFLQGESLETRVTRSVKNLIEASIVRYGEIKHTIGFIFMRALHVNNGKKNLLLSCDNTLNDLNDAQLNSFDPSLSELQAILDLNQNIATRTWTKNKNR